MNAVDSEHKKNLQNEARRALQVFRNEADISHPLNHFRTGSLDTLQKAEIRDILLAFHKDFYSANLMGVGILGRESLEGLEEMALSAGFDKVVNKNVSLPDFKFAFTEHEWHMSRVGRIAKHVLNGRSSGSSSPAGVTSPSSPSKKLHNLSLPVMTVIEPVKEERYFAFQFFTEEQDKEHWREKVDSFWGHVLGYEGPGSLLSYLKSKGFATGLSAGMYYDGGGTGVFQIRVSLTKEKGVKALAEIGELVFKYLLMVKKDMDLGTLTRIWQEQRDLAKLRFQFRPVADPVDSVLSSSRNVLLYPAEEILSAGTLLYEPIASEKIFEFFDYFRLDNLRLVVFHQNCTDVQWEWYNGGEGGLKTGVVDENPGGSSSSSGGSTGVLTEPHFGVKHRKPMKLHPTLLQRWQEIDQVMDSIPSANSTTPSPEAETKPSSPAGKQAMKLKFDLASVNLPDEFFIMRKNEFIPTKFDVHWRGYEGWDELHQSQTAQGLGITPDGAYWPVKQYHGINSESTTTTPSEGSQVDLSKANHLYRLTIPFSSTTPSAAAVKEGSAAVVNERNPAYRIFFKSTTYPYEEPRVYCKVNLYSDFISQSLDAYCRTLFFVQTVLEKLNEDFYDSEICGLDYDVVTHSFGGLTIYVGGYSDKLFLLLEKLLERFMNALPEVDVVGDNDGTTTRQRTEGEPKMASALQVLKERKLKAWYNASYKKQPLEVAGQMIDEAVADCDYPMKDMYEWLLVNQEKITCKSLKQTQIDLFAGRVVGEGLVEGNLDEGAMREVGRILQKHLPLREDLDGGASSAGGVDVEKGSSGNDRELPGFKKGVKRIQGDSVLVQPSPNPNDPNSATILYVQTGAYCRVKDLRKERETLFAGGLRGTTAAAIREGDEFRDSFFDKEEDKLLVRTRTLNMLLTQFLAQPFFADLRTKQQLGYLVSARADFVNGMTGIHFRVQSSHTNCKELEKRIKTFFDNFEENILKQKTEDDFEEFKKGIISKLEEKPKKLAQEFSLHWSEISFRSMNFFWKDSAVAFLKELKWEEFLGYWREEVFGKPKMWVHVPGPTDESVGREAVADVKLGEFEQLVNNRIAI